MGDLLCHIPVFESICRETECTVVRQFAEHCCCQPQNKSTKIMTISLYSFIFFTVFVWSNNRIFFFLSPHFWFPPIRRQTEPQPTLRLCAVHFRRKTYCRFLVVHSACIWKHRRSHSHISQKGWEEENELSNLPFVSRLLSLNPLISCTLATRATIPESVQKYDILSVCGVTNSHLSIPRPSLCWSSLKLSSVPPPSCFPSPHSESGDISSGRPSLLSQGLSLWLRWRGCCSLCKSAWRPVLQGRQRGRRGEC